MSDDGHKYTFYGFDGPYWAKKAQREAMDELVRITEELGLYEAEEAYYRGLSEDEDGSQRGRSSDPAS